MGDGRAGEISVERGGPYPSSGTSVASAMTADVESETFVVVAPVNFYL